MTYPIGTHLKISRASGLYTHHGIYVSNGEVIHYAGFCEIFKYEPIGQVFGGVSKKSYAYRCH